jgi:hypothetical protein
MSNRRLSIVVVNAGVLLAAAGMLHAQEPAQVVPISAYVNALGNLTAQGWLDPANGNTLFIDAYGKRDAFFGLNVGTSTTGRVTVKNLGNGTQRVTVNLHTKNAICWGFNAAGQLAFGYRPVDVQSNLGPASLGDVMTRIEFTQTVGPVDPAAPWNSITATVMCDGQLRSGSGEPDGTPGFAQTTQVGVFNTGAPGGCPPNEDGNCFPAEKIQFKSKSN